MNECCNTCKFRKKLINYDYSGKGCRHTDYDGFACIVFAHEGVVIHHTGRLESGKGELCEEYVREEVQNHDD